LALHWGHRALGGHGQPGFGRRIHAVREHQDGAGREHRGRRRRLNGFPG